jgi:hypothetical protein
MSKEQLRLSDEVISQIAKLVQLAILSGTDVVDHLRLMRVVNDEDDDSSLVLSNEYRQISEDQIKSMLDQVAPTESEDVN